MNDNVKNILYLTPGFEHLSRWDGPSPSAETRPAPLAARMKYVRECPNRGEPVGGACGQVRRCAAGFGEQYLCLDGLWVIESDCYRCAQKNADGSYPARALTF